MYYLISNDKNGQRIEQSSVGLDAIQKSLDVYKEVWTKTGVEIDDNHPFMIIIKHPDGYFQHWRIAQQIRINN